MNLSMSVLEDCVYYCHEKFSGNSFRTLRRKEKNEGIITSGQVIMSNLHISMSYFYLLFP